MVLAALMSRLDESAAVEEDDVDMEEDEDDEDEVL